MNHTALNILATLLVSSTAMADLALQGLGTGPAPTSIGGYTLTAAAPDNRTLGQIVSGVAASSSEWIEFTAPLQHLRVGQGWGTWSHGYTGDVYSTMGANSVRLDFAPAVTAFMLYVQGSNFNTSRFTVTAESPDGTTVSTSRNIVGNGGAQGVAFWTDAGFTLTSVEIVNPTGSAGGFAIGEFSYAVPAPGASALLSLTALARRRRSMA